ncbi:MAG: MBL fold metallo-hydrolase [Candidatus Coatesbacteria bacterium]|nr:MBL fold metallo-hydrolase [Candidatus Coatesbacteria bacterium]
MQIKIWGTRGVTVSPGKSTKIYGGNTTCIQVFSENGNELLVDAGTGIIRRGKEAKPAPDKRYHILFSHTHLDHISGFVFFLPIQDPESHITIYSPEGTEKNLLDIFENLFQEQYSPLRSLKNVAAKIDFQPLFESEDYIIDGFKVSTVLTDHTTKTLGYRIEADEKSFCMITDHNARPSVYNDRVLELCKDCDLLMHDAQFSDEEYTKRLSYGHSSISLAISNGISANCRNLLLFHHDPSHEDAYLEKVEAEIKGKKNDMNISIAKETSLIEV